MKQKKDVTILAIETSCDETAAAILQGDPTSKTPNFKTLSSIVRSQINIHKKSGGVIPEVAARAHVANILPVVETTLKQAKVNLSLNPSPSQGREMGPTPSHKLGEGGGEVDYIAVTSGPGLIVSLVVGVEFAKGLSLATSTPMLPTNHMAGHLYSAFSQSKIKSPTSAKATADRQKLKVQFPILSLIVSGGHTLLVVMKDYKHYKVIGSTVDDAAGEAFDKVAKLLNLPYPGGPEISKLAEKGNPSAIEFPRPMLNQPNFDFSFSGLKTAVRNYVTGQQEDREKRIEKSRIIKADIARAFEDAVVDVLVQKTLRAVHKYKCKTISLSGGVAANKKLREELERVSAGNKLNFIRPEMELCTDNAQMIAIAAYFDLFNGKKPVSYDKVHADPGWEIG